MKPLTPGRRALMTTTIGAGMLKRLEQDYPAPASERRRALLEQIFARWEKEFIQGQRELLLDALALCIHERVPLPRWIERAFITGYLRGRHFYQAQSWDQVFGRPMPKGTHAKKVERALLIATPIFAAVHRRQQAGESIDKGLFEKVGKEVGREVGIKVSGTLASEIYYRGRSSRRATKTSRKI